MAGRSPWRVLTPMSALALVLALAALTVAIVASAFAQAPPSPPHKFWGSADVGSGAALNGAPAPDGTVVTAWNADGAAVAQATISLGSWSLDVRPDVADSVVFTINGSLPSAAFEVQSAGSTQVALDLDSPPAEEAPIDTADATPDESAADDAAPDAVDDEEPAAAPDSPRLPEAGSGGLLDRAGARSVPVLIFAISLLVGIGGVIAVRRLRA